MKKHVFKLISGLLATTVLLVGCNGGDETPFDTAARTMKVVDANFKLTDYVEYDNSYEYLTYSSSSLKDLIELYGQKEYSSGSIYVFKKITKDFKNNVTEEFSVYNAETDKVVKTLKNEYFDGNYGELDDFGHVKKAPKTLDISLIERNSIRLIKAVEKTNAQIDEGTIEEEELDTSYATSIKTSYYDVEGKEIISSNLPVEVEVENVTESECKMLIGNKVAIFNRETEALVDCWDTQTTQKPALYDYQNDKYGFYFGDGYSSKVAFEAYDIKTGKLVNRYYFGSGCMGNVVVLNSGDVLVQKLKLATEYDYDVKEGYNYFKLESLLVDAASGKSAKIEGCNYMFNDVVDAYDVEEFGLKFTDKKINVLTAYEIKDKEYVGSEVIVFMADDLTINGVYDGKVLINQEDDFVVPERVSSDSYIVDIQDPAFLDFNKALVNENNALITYVPNGANVIGEYIYTNDGIYNKNLERVVEYDNVIAYADHSFVGMVGGYAIFTYVDSYDYSTGIVAVSPHGYTNTISDSYIDEINSEYLLVVNNTSNGYVLYNANMNSILSSENSMTVNKAENNLIVETYAYGKNVTYFFSGNGGAL